MKRSDYLKKKKTRETRKKIISVISAIVVFVTTYALVLPAITLDVSRASREPGMVLEQMQFKTTASAASVTAADSTVEVQAEETQVEEPADEAPAEEETIQEEPAESSEEETSAVSDEPEEVPAEPEQAETPAEPAQEEAPAEPAQEEAPAAEAETEVVQEDKSEDSSSETASSPETDASEAQTADTQKSTDQAAVDQSGTEITDAAAAASTAETAAEFQIPTLDALDFDDILTGKTAFYYYHPENAEEAESISSDSVDDWKKAGSDTVLAPEDFVRVYLSYEIPAGSLNETNTEARYRLPAGLELSDKQIKAINKYENGIASSKSGSEHDKYLGAEAIEGSRTPDEKAGDEYISATVKAEKIYKEGNYVGQDLIFTFIPFTVEKNQISYDEAGKLASEGRNVKGFFTFDLTTAQIDFEKTEKETVEKEDGKTEEIQYSKAEVVFVKENNDRNIDEISRTLTLAAPAEKKEPKILTSEGSDYTVTVSYTEAAQIPDNAELAVREIEKDSDEYASYLEQAKGALDDTKSVNEARFFDITILVDGEKVEPQAPVNVQITFTGIEQTNTDDTQLLHYKDDKEVEIMDKAEFSKSEESEDETKAVDTVQFETDGFSVYGIVGTESLTTQYITAKGETYTITVTYDKDAEIPDGATLEVSELANDSKDYTDYVEQAAKALAEGEEVPFVNAARLFDISIMADGKKVEPKAPVEVKIEYANAENLNETSEVGTVHFKESTFKTETEVMDVSVQGEEGKVDGVTFTTDSFSIYAVVIIDKEAGTFVVEDENYKITITYTKEAELPIGTEMIVEEITPDTDRFWELCGQTIETINKGVEWENQDLPDPRKGITSAAFFDITLKYAGKEIEPKESVHVEIEYKKNGILVPDEEKTEIAHFAKRGVEVISDVEVGYSDESSEEGRFATTYEYDQSSFSEVGSFSTGEYIEINNQGGTIYPLAAPALRAADTSITASKTITDSDNDGVYELALSVTGSSESSSHTTVNKSNVVLVIDTSGSMRNNYTYSQYTYNASTYNQNNEYYGVYDGNYYRVVRNNNNTGWRYRDYNSSYTGTVYQRQTRMEATKAAAQALVTALLANNEDRTTEDGTSLRDIVEISVITFAGARNNNTNGYLRTLDSMSTDETTINTHIGNISAVGGTNWEMALKQAKTEADKYNNQTGETTSIIFLTDGKPTFYGSNDNGDGQEGDSNVQTCWNNASDDARALVTSGYTLYNIFAFGTDTGTNSGSNYLKALTNYAYTGTGSYSNYGDTTYTRNNFFDATDTTALEQAFQKIINNINNTVGFGGVTVDDGVTTGVTNTSVTVDGTVNNSSFHYSIKNGNTVLATVKINGNTATFTSPTTGNTATATGVETTVNINGTNHTNTLFIATLDGVEYKITPAKMDNKGEVVWELAPVGIIENGRTYEVSFDVWPNQLSYDLVADLNNGIYKTREEALATISDAAVRSQIDTALVGPDANGKYSIRTNYQQYVDYYTVDTTQEEGQDPVTTYTPQPRKELGPKDPVALTSSTMDMIKHWEDSLDEEQLGEWLYKDYPNNTQSNERKVKLHVWKADTLEDLNNQIESYSEAVDGSYAQADEHDYLAKTLGWNGSTYVWEDSLEVAPGTMIELSKARDEMGIDVSKHTQVTYGSKTYVVLESGHYYTVTEENIERHFELNTIIYHPMLVDGVLSNVTFKADGTVENIVPMSTVDAINTLKGGINVLKRAYDGETEIVATDDTFTVEVTVKNADGTPYTDFDYRIYYGTNNPKYEDTTMYPRHRTGHIFGTTKTDDNTTEFTNNKEPGEAQHTILGNTNGVITLDLYIGDTVRIINVPAGVTYSVVETKVNGEELNGGAAGGYVFNTVKYEISEGTSENYVADDSHTVKGNSSSQAKVLNKIPTQKIGLKKIGDAQKDNTLSGVTFKLYKDADLTNQVTKDALGNAIGTNGVLTTGSDGNVEIGTLLAGTYYLVETGLGDNKGYNLLADPVVITINKDNSVTYDRRVSYTQTGYSAAQSDPDHVNGAGLLIEEKTDAQGLTYYYYTVTVNNSTGVSLPNTGGSGTLPYTLGGIALIMASALMYGFRMRRRERRLN